MYNWKRGAERRLFGSLSRIPLRATLYEVLKKEQIMIQLHLWRLGDRVSVVRCKGEEKSAKKIVFFSHEDDRFEITPLASTDRLDNDQFPCHARLVSSINGGKDECVGYFYDVGNFSGNGSHVVLFVIDK